MAPRLSGPSVAERTCRRDGEITARRSGRFVTRRSIKKKKNLALFEAGGGGGEIPRPPNHKRHLFRRDIFRSDDQVPLVLAVCRIEYNDEFPSTCPPPDLTPQLAAGSLLSKTRNRCETFKISYTPLPPNRRAGRGKGVREGYGEKEGKKEKKKAHGTPRQPPVSS